MLRIVLSHISRKFSSSIKIQNNKYFSLCMLLLYSDMWGNTVEENVWLKILILCSKHYTTHTLRSMYNKNFSTVQISISRLHAINWENTHNYCSTKKKLYFLVHKPIDLLFQIVQSSLSSFSCSLSFTNNQNFQQFTWNNFVSMAHEIVEVIAVAFSHIFIYSLEFSCCRNFYIRLLWNVMNHDGAAPFSIPSI